MRLIRRSSRRFTPRQVEYTYPELRNARSTQKRGMLDRSEGDGAADTSIRSGRAGR